MLDSVLQRISPTPEEQEELRRVSNELRLLIEKHVKNVDSRIFVRVLGSSARNTWLRYEKDIDIFVFFPTEYTKSQLEDITTEAAKRVLESWEKHYAEHPYVRGVFKGYEVEVVPCYAVASAKDKKSAVDRTPFHHEYVANRIKGKEDDVRLLKQFLKGIGAYGAEAKVQGFSGYLCELLIIKFGSFMNLIEAASQFKHGVVLYLEKPPKDLKKFKGDAMIFIDPVDENRNVASAVSEEKFSLFVHACREFLKNPRESFFFPKPRVVKKERIAELIKRRRTGFIAVSFEKPDVVDDILYSQIRKALKLIRGYFNQREFRVYGSAYHVDSSIVFLFELESLELPEAKVHLGPFIGSSHEERFLSKHSNSQRALTKPFIQGRRWAVVLRRRITTAEECLRWALSMPMPSHIASALKKGYKILQDMEVLNLDKNFLAEYLDPRFPWEREDENAQ